MSQPPPDQPPDELLEVTTAAQFKALGHPLRQRLLLALGERSATISQLAPALGVRKGTVAHHLAVLREAGMVRATHTRAVRGGTEQYYQRSARRLSFAGRHPEPTAALLGAVAAELGDAPGEPLLHLRHLRLTAAQAEHLRATLLDLVTGAEDAGADEPRYGVLVSLYRKGAPPASGTPPTEESRKRA